MKYIIIVGVLLAASHQLFGQENTQHQPRMFFQMGFVSPQYIGGTELLRARDLRTAGLSYGVAENGERSEVGSYGANTGFSLSIGYYLPVKKVRGLSIGALVNSGQTGSNPSTGGYPEGYFFNFLNFGLGAQYYPFKNANLYLEGEVGMGSVFTKNRFQTEEGEQDFLHHFGIGVEGGGGIGYTFTPFSTDRVGLFVESSYQFYSTRVEVSGMGDDQWVFGALHISAGVSFDQQKHLTQSHLFPKRIQMAFFLLI